MFSLLFIFSTAPAMLTLKSVLAPLENARLCVPNYDKVWLVKSMGTFGAQGKRRGNLPNFSLSAELKQQTKRHKYARAARALSADMCVHADRQPACVPRRCKPNG